MSIFLRENVIVKYFFYLHDIVQGLFFGDVNISVVDCFVDLGCYVLEYIDFVLKERGM